MIFFIYLEKISKCFWCLKFLAFRSELHSEAKQFAKERHILMLAKLKQVVTRGLDQSEGGDERGRDEGPHPGDW